MSLHFLLRSRPYKTRLIRALCSICVAISLVAASSFAGTEAYPPFVRMIGSVGNGPGQYTQPIGVGLDPQGHVYVADRGQNKIIKYSNDGTFLAEFGTFGNGPGQFQVLIDVTVDSQGRIYVSDESRIDVFDSSFNFIAAWPGLGDLEGYLALSPDGSLLYTNTAPYLKIFSTTNGALVVSNRRYENIYNGAYGISTDASGNFYVTLVDVVGKYAPPYADPLLLGWGYGQFSSATAVAANDPAGPVYVAGDGRIQEFSSNGTYISQWNSGAGAAPFHGSPIDMAVDGNGNVFVVVDNLVEEFGVAASTPVLPLSWHGLMNQYRR